MDLFAGMLIYGVIHGEARPRKIMCFRTNGEELVIVTDRSESLIWGLDAFQTKKEAEKEIRSRLKDC